MPTRRFIADNGMELRPERRPHERRQHPCPRSAASASTPWRRTNYGISIVYGPHCSAENFYDADALKAVGGQPPVYWSCKRQVRLPARIHIGKHIVMLNADTRLYPHHIDDYRMYDFSQPVAEMTQHPKDPNVWGIKNLSDEPW